MTWRDPDHTRLALKRGHAAVSCDHGDTYLDYAQSCAPTEPRAQPGLVVDLASVHGHEPPDDSGTAGALLGMQAQLWTEFAPTAEHVDRLAFPRLCALADRAWHGSPSWAGFRTGSRRTPPGSPRSVSGTDRSTRTPPSPVSIPHRSGKEQP
ncbi:hypothetical protein SALBM135S_00579 [Streptomyces alboniger]